MILPPTQPAVSPVYFVSPAGKDTAAGTEERPWTTLQYAADHIHAGDTVTVLAGHYAGFQLKTSGSADRRIAFNAKSGAVIESRNAITPDGINLEGASYITIRGFDVEKIPRAGIRSVTNAGVSIVDNRINAAGMWGILTGFSENVDIESNSISGSIQQHGIYVSNSADNPVIRGNRVWDNRQSGIQINADASMGGDGIITGAVVEKNIVYNNGAGGGAAINLDGVQRSIVQDNLLYDNRSNGIALYKIDGAQGPTGDVIQNNTIVMPSNGGWDVVLRGGGAGNVIANNILLNRHRFRGAISSTPDSVAGLMSDYNIAARFSNDDGDSAMSLAAWHRATGQDAHSFEAYAEDLFVNPAGHDYHLSNNSPAIGAGALGRMPEGDLDGKSRPAQRADIGAFTAAPNAVAHRPSYHPVRWFHRLSRPIKIAMGLLVLAAIGCGVWLWRQVRLRGLDRWLPTYLRHRGRYAAPSATAEVHLILCIADHFEPRYGDPSPAIALKRATRWAEEYPRQLGAFRDSDGRAPQHTFFYPLEQYDPNEMDHLAELCRGGFGEVEVHLHHDHDTAENLRDRLLAYTQMLSSRHGLMARDRQGRLRYGFVHGNWALDNSRPDGRWCGVNNELDVLRETGCYADFTLPSFPSPTQTRKINSIYYAVDDPARPRSHDGGVDVGRGDRAPESLLLIQGPLLPNWKNRRHGLLPRIENACLQANQVPTMTRLDLWLRARIQVPSRPNWYFVKLHTHGAPEDNASMLLGDPMIRFHAALARRAADNARFKFHYVTAREMYNLVKAAEADFRGAVEEARDFELTWSASQSPAAT